MGGGNKELSCTNTNDNIADVHHDSRGIGGHGYYDPAAAYYSCPPIAYPPPGVHGCPPSYYLPNQGYGYGSYGHGQSYAASTYRHHRDYGRTGYHGHGAMFVVGGAAAVAYGAHRWSHGGGHHHGGYYPHRPAVAAGCLRYGGKFKKHHGGHYGGKFKRGKFFGGVGFIHGKHKRWK